MLKNIIRFTVFLTLFLSDSFLSSIAFAAEDASVSGDGSMDDSSGTSAATGTDDSSTSVSTPSGAGIANSPQNSPFFPAPQQPVECFGIMGAGQNDNVFVDEDGTQYGYGEAPACHPMGSILLPKDSLYNCENIVVGQTDKGELIRGSLKPNSQRRSPVICYPYDFVNQKITYMNPQYAIPMTSS